jgi:RNA polymerase sigma-70 factor (ECF subfamily)
MNLKEKEKIFSQIYDEFKHRIYRICYAYIYEKNEVEDLFQEIIVNIWNSLDTFRGDAQLGTWVYRVAVNTALFHNRKFRSHESAKASFCQLNHIHNSSSCENIDESSQRLDGLARAISQLEKQDRLVISLLLEELTYDSIAQVVGITPNYVGVRVNRIKKQLKNILENESN